MLGTMLAAAIAHIARAAMTTSRTTTDGVLGWPGAIPWTVALAFPGRELVLSLPLLLWAKTSGALTLGQNRNRGKEGAEKPIR
jgi:hypothetical protein